MQQKAGFTIVELLIVIVVIGILAALTIIGYVGVSGRAGDASVKSDATNAAKILENDKTLSSTNSYPANAAAANGGKGLKASNGNTYSYAPNNSSNPPSYVLTVTRSGSSNNYRVTSTDSTPILIVGLLPVVTLHPVSWIAFSHTFTAAATGSPTPTVQWQKSFDNSTWADIAGATNTSYPASGPIPCTQVYFRAIFTNTVGSVITNTAFFEGPCGD